MKVSFSKKGGGNDWSGHFTENIIIAKDEHENVWRFENTWYIQENPEVLWYRQKSWGNT